MFPSKLIVYWILIIIFSTQSQTHTFLSRRQELFYNNFKQANGSNNLTLSGIAQIDSNGCLQLTNGTRRAIGHAFYSSPFRLKRSPSGPALSFSTMFAFAIVPHAESYGGHGMAFSMVPDKELKGVFPGQYLGLLNPEDDGNLTNHVFAIEFDTVMDYESRDVNDNHVGIDINSMKSKASVAAGYYVDGNSEYQNLSLRSGKTILSWVDYDSAETQIDVRLSFTSQKPNRSVLSFKADLSHCLDEFMFVGFSASTGMIASSHYVMGWSFHVSGVALPLDLTSLARLPTPKGSKARAVVVGASLGSALGIIIALLGVWRYKNKDVVEPWELHVGPHRFPYRELRKATKGFSDKEVIGFGGFGKVYRGILPKTREEVAVKRISHDSKQGLQEFLAEIASIGHLRHRNLVQLLGWGRRLGDLLLVYEFMPNGSLDKYLFGEPMMVLSWELRFTIIKGVARGLVYLHEGWEQTVIHRDVKAANVLLDGEFNGRLTDFGLAKLYERGSNPTTTRVVGTMGYLAPELTKTCKPTTFSDVYAFGAFLLEVACGRRPVEPKALPEELILVDFVWDKWKGGAILDVMDAKLKGVYDEVEAVMVLKLGLICSADKPVCRPSMKQVLQYLEGEVPMPEVVLAPGGYDGKQGGVGSSVFEDYELSYSSPPKPLHT